MKSIKSYIIEKLKITSDNINNYTYIPENKTELQNIIKDRIEKEGYQIDLNDIDISLITDLCGLFQGIKGLKLNELDKLEVNVSKWDTSNVEDMTGLFYNMSKFNCDISEWNTKNVKSMANMFTYCSEFNQDISKWNVENVKNVNSMFMNCSKFNQNLNDWKIKIKDKKALKGCFYECPLEKNLPKWYKIK